jgi:AAA domain, putative AbiEii toxin, Type IV TA system
VALPLIHERLLSDPLVMFKQWLGRIIILRPVPSLIYGDSSRETLQPNPQVSDIGAWFSGILSDAPSSWARIDQHLRQVMPDFKEIKNLRVGRDSKSLAVHFASDQGSLEVPFGDLSDGEKCFVICALVLATHDANGGVFCFWDEPDNYLALSEVGHFILALRRAYQSGGQFIATSHNPEAIRRFSHENTLVLYRKSHLEPTMVRPLSELQVNGDLVGALVRGDLEP